MAGSALAFTTRTGTRRGAKTRQGVGWFAIRTGRRGGAGRGGPGRVSRAGARARDGTAGVAGGVAGTGRGRGRGFTAMVGVPAILIFAAIYALWPRATIVVSPVVTEMRHRVVVQATTAADAVDVEGGKMPARAVGDSFTVSVTVPVSGSVRSGAARARGTVVFINEGSKPVTVREGTVVATTAGVEFRTLSAVVVPASTVKSFAGMAVDADPGTASVEVEADEPGTQGNVAAGRIAVVRGRSSSASLKVTNPEPTSGGEDKITPAVSPVDLRTARKRLAAEASEVAAQRLAEDLPRNHRLLAETIAVQQQEPVFDHVPHSPSAELRASCRASARALAVKEADLLKVVRGRFLLRLAEDAMLVTSTEADVKISKVKRIDAESATIEAVASAGVVAPLDADRLARELAGKTVEEAKSLLGAGRGVSAFSIYPAGDDTRRLPRFARWIRVVVGRPEGNQK